MSEATDKQLIKAARQARDADDEDWVLGSPQGRRYVQRILKRYCRYDDASPEGSMQETNTWAGRRGVGCDIRGDVLRSGRRTSGAPQGGEELLARMAIEFSTPPAPLRG